MGFIVCTSACKYQKEGVCILQHAASSGISSDSGCIHYIPKDKVEYEKKENKEKKSTHQIDAHS